jgi:hypothetical protein
LNTEIDDGHKTPKLSDQKVFDYQNLSSAGASMTAQPVEVIQMADDGS